MKRPSRKRPGSVPEAEVLKRVTDFRRKHGGGTVHPLSASVASFTPYAISDLDLPSHRDHDAFERNAVGRATGKPIDSAEARGVSEALRPSRWAGRVRPARELSRNPICVDCRSHKPECLLKRPPIHAHRGSTAAGRALNG